MGIGYKVIFLKLKANFSCLLATIQLSICTIYGNMLKKLFGILVQTSLLFVFVQTAFAQHSALQNARQFIPDDVGHICTLDPTDINAHYRYVPMRLRAKQPGAMPGSTFDITYVNSCGSDNWPDEAVTAFEHTLAIWSTYIQSAIPIRVEATWNDLGTNVLGSAGPSTFYVLDEDTGEAKKDVFYAISQLSAMLDFDIVNDLDGSPDFDILVNINCQFPDWYFGTDANPPTNAIDLVTVMLHEIGHGLGFSGSVSASSTSQTANWGFQTQQGGTSYPVIYDLFTVDGLFNGIIDELAFSNPSGALYEAVTGRNNGLFFSAAETEFAHNGERVPLYSPFNWAGGSSYSHLDQTFFSNTENALMRPFIDRAFAVHSPGPVFCGMLTDMGWPLGPSCLELLEDDQILQRPDLLVPQNGAQNTGILPGFEWSAVNGAEGYQIQISQDFEFTSQIANEFTNELTFALQNELEYSGLYFWRVRALSAAGNSSWGGTNRFFTLQQPPEQVTLSLPENGAENLRPQQLLIRWDAANRADGYTIQVSESPDFSNPLINRDVTATLFSDLAGLDLYTDYYWRVRGNNRAGGGDWSETWTFKTIIEKPEMVFLGGPDDDETQVAVNPEFSWNASARAAEYILQVSQEEDFSILELDQTTTETAASGMVPLEFATIYFWRVKAINIGGESDWSAASTFTTEVRETRINPNYPNPFNSVTTLRYQLSDQRDVLIDVFDIAGRRVAVVVNEQKSPGVYFERLNSAHFASGTYLVRFVAGDVMDIQKISVIK